MATIPLLYSCDDHLDFGAVPPDLFETRLPANLRERGPRVVERDGARVWVADDRVIGTSGSNPTYSAIARAGIDDPDGSRASDPKRRLEDMDRDHLQVSVIYGPHALGMPIDDADLKAACLGAWNDWAIDFNQVAPQRLCILAFLPGHEPAAAAKELERAARAGHRGAILDIFDMDLGDPAWDLLWAAAADTQLPISFHLKGGASSLTWQPGSWKSAAFATVAPMQLDEGLATMVFSGALDRHPGMRLVLAESGIGWIPYFVARMDLEWEGYRDKIDVSLSVPPSEIFKRQVYATFEEESLGEQLIPLLGADHFMWASDYPHPDSTFPRSVDAVDEALGGLPESDRRKITAENCANLYGFELV